MLTVTLTVTIQMLTVRPKKIVSNPHFLMGNVTGTVMFGNGKYEIRFTGGTVLLRILHSNRNKDGTPHAQKTHRGSARDPFYPDFNVDVPTTAYRQAATSTSSSSTQH